MAYASEAEEGGVKVKQSSVNVESTKSQYSEHFNRRRFPKDSDIPLSDMNISTQNECKSFAMESHVNLFLLNNMEFNGTF